MSHPLVEVQKLLREATILDIKNVVEHGRVRLVYYKPRPDYSIAAEYRSDVIQNVGRLTEESFAIRQAVGKTMPSGVHEIGIVSHVDQSCIPEDLHIGFVDCENKDLSRLETVIYSYLYNYLPVSVYETDRSYHIYLTKGLLSQKTWLQFLGDLILANDHAFKCWGQGVFDIRWIGHSLQRGFGVLRWSSNDSTKYSMQPHIVKRLEIPSAPIAVAVAAVAPLVSPLFIPAATGLSY